MIIKMATIARRGLLAVTLLALMVLFAAGVRQRQSTKCVQLTRPHDCCADTFFVRKLQPFVGYSDSDDRELTFAEKWWHRHYDDICRITCDDHCFSNMPNALTFLIFSNFPTCSEDFTVLPPCRSLCEAAEAEYIRYSVDELLHACPTTYYLIWLGFYPMYYNVFSYIKSLINCSQYATHGNCVPERPPSMSCDFLPSTHIARHVINSSHFQTGYPTANNNLQGTHLLSLTHANAEFRSYGLKAMVNDSECRNNLPSTIFFITLAYFPLCTTHKDRDSILTYPCRNACEAARIELERHWYDICQERSYKKCPAASGLTLTIAQVLELPVFTCSKYSQSGCVDSPACPNESSCSVHESNQDCTNRCGVSFRNNVTGNSFMDKQFGKCQIIKCSKSSC